MKSAVLVALLTCGLVMLATADGSGSCHIIVPGFPHLPPCDDISTECCTALRVVAGGRQAVQQLGPGAIAGKCGRKEQVRLFNCAKSTGLPLFHGTATVDSSVDGNGLCTVHRKNIIVNNKFIGPTHYTEWKHVSSGCCDAIQNVMNSGAAANEAGRSIGAPEEGNKEILLAAGKCGRVDQESLLTHPKMYIHDLVAIMFAAVDNQATKVADTDAEVQPVVAGLVGFAAGATFVGFLGVMVYRRRTVSPLEELMIA